MNPNVLVAIVSAGGVVLSAVISWLVSRGAAKREIEKMKLSWEREDIVSSDDEFAEMASAVAAYMHSMAVNTKAVMMVAAIRSKESGKLAELLDKLYEDLVGGPNQFKQLEDDLSAVIQEKRKRKSPEK